MGQEEYQELSSFLRRFIRRLRLLRGLEGLCLTAICALLLFALGAGVFELKEFFPTRRSPTAFSPRLVLVARHRLVDVSVLCAVSHQERAALYIEQKQPKLRNNLINSLQLYPQISQAQSGPGFSASMVLALLRTTRKQVATLQIDDLIDNRQLKSSLRLLAITFAPVLAMVLFNPSWVGETYQHADPAALDHLPPIGRRLKLSPKACASCAAHR